MIYFHQSFQRLPLNPNWYSSFPFNPSHPPSPQIIHFSGPPQAGPLPEWLTFSPTLSQPLSLAKFRSPFRHFKQPLGPITLVTLIYSCLPHFNQTLVPMLTPTRLFRYPFRHPLHLPTSSPHLSITIHPHLIDPFSPPD